MQVADLFDVHAPFEVPVHERDRQEEGLVVTLEVS